MLAESLIPPSEHRSVSLPESFQIFVIRLPFEINLPASPGNTCLSGVLGSGYPFCAFTRSPSVASPKLNDIANHHVAKKALKQHDNFMLDSGNHSSLEGNPLFRLTSPLLLPSTIPPRGTQGSYTLDYTLLIYSAKQPFT